jgi:hypothetical protein
MQEQVRIAQEVNSVLELLDDALRLKLAESILICSHAQEVQRHFPYRWEVRKQDGTATVRRTSPDAAD